MIYTIKKGNHYSGLHFKPLLFDSKLEFNFSLSKETWFQIKEIDDLDINKLFGRSFGLHHRDSIRLGWVPKKGSPFVYNIYVYYYNKGVRKYELFPGDFTIGINYNCSMSFNILINDFDIKIGNKTITYMFDYPKFKFGYLLYPYFGGNKVAYKDIQFKINLI